MIVVYKLSPDGELLTLEAPPYCDGNDIAQMVNGVNYHGSTATTPEEAKAEAVANGFEYGSSAVSSRQYVQKVAYTPTVQSAYVVDDHFLRTQIEEYLRQKE